MGPKRVSMNVNFRGMGIRHDFLSRIIHDYYLMMLVLLEDQILRDDNVLKVLYFAVFRTFSFLPFSTARVDQFSGKNDPESSSSTSFKLTKTSFSVSVKTLFWPFDP